MKMSEFYMWDSNYKPNINDNMRFIEVLNAGIKNIGVAIVNVIYDPPATVAYWSDGTKTVVESDYGTYDRATGILMCMAKKAYGSIEKFHEVLKARVSDNKEGNHD